MPSPVHPYSDYGVALRTLRTARGWLGFLLLICVVWQFIGFCLMYYTQQPYKGSHATWSWPANLEEARARLHGKNHSTTAAATHTAGEAATAASQPEEPFYPGSKQSRDLNIRDQWNTAYGMLVPLTQLAGLIAVSSQAIILFITLLVVLVAQAPGVAQLTRALIWSVLLLFMFLPWRYFLKDFPINGVIYSYSELLDLIGPIVVGDKVYRYQVFIIYARFIIWPIVGLFVALVTAERYRAGIMIAIGHPLQSMLQPRPSAIAATPRATATIPSLPFPNPENKPL